ncbi:MAG: TolB family protein [Leptolyngbyaceae cyanobacterium SL_5_14]|nr:TolB family protein [Leptolyngbyaceae cyanobacterium SL_5_14]
MDRIRHGLDPIHFLISCQQNTALACSDSLNSLNSLHTEEQPALSGDGQFIAYVSNRNGTRGILLFDLKDQKFIDLPRLNRPDAIAENPSISNTARYIVYVASDRGRADIQLYDRVTEQVQVLTAGYRGWVRHPSISPDGRYITFETGSNGQWDIEVIDRGTIELDVL